MILIFIWTINIKSEEGTMLAEAETTTTTTLSHENNFIHEICQNKTPVSIFLVNGIRLQGVISDYDHTTLMLESATKQVVFKHAISTIMVNADK